MSDDDLARELREQLDRELAGVHSDPAALRAVLARGRREPRRREGPPAWFLAAAAVVAVAVAVPVLANALSGGDAQSPERLAGAALPATSTPAATVPVPRPTPMATLHRSVPVAPPVAPAPRTARPTRPPAPTSSPTVRPTATATAPPPPAPVTCGAGSPTAAAPSSSGSVAVDLDGDGAPDLLSTDGSALSARLSSGGTASGLLRGVSGSLSVLPVETDGSNGVELLLLTRGAVGSDGSVGMRGTLYDLRGCSLVPVSNALGTPYVFEIGGNTAGTRTSGVQCERDVLEGVTSVAQADGTVWSVTRTPVRSGSGRALNGTPSVSSLSSADPVAASLREASCGTQQPIPLQP